MLLFYDSEAKLAKTNRIAHTQATAKEIRHVDLSDVQQSNLVNTESWKLKRNQ